MTQRTKMREKNKETMLNACAINISHIRSFVLVQQLAINTWNMADGL